MKQQTAMKSHIQWLYDNQLELNIPIEVIEDAEDRLEMEKQEIIDAHISGYDSSGESAKDYYDYYYGSNANDKDSNVCNSQTEISDEEIVNEAIEHSNLYTNKFTPRNAFIMGAKWYREQLKKIVKQ